MIPFNISNKLRSLLIFAAILLAFSASKAQNESSTTGGTEQFSTNKNAKNAQKNAFDAEKNANDLRKITLLLAIAQDRDRQAAEATEDIRSRRLRIEEDLLDAEDNPKKFTKKEIADLDTQLKSLQKKEKLALKARESANTFLLEVTQAVAAEPTKRSKFISNYEKKMGPVNDSKYADSAPIEPIAPTEKEQMKSVAVAEKSKRTPTTPSVQTPNLSENVAEIPSDLAVPKTKKKAETKPKQNEKPNKPEGKKPNTKVTKAKEPKVIEAEIPPVLAEMNTNSEASEPVVEPKKEVKKTAKKESKKKQKKVEKTVETPVKTEEFPLVFTESTPQTPPQNEQKVENTPTVNSEKTADIEPEKVETDVKSSKKSKKKEKKPKKSETTEVAQGSLVSYRTYEKNADVYMTTPAPDCAIAFEGKDEFTGKMKRETMPVKFFTHTDDIMRKALQDKDFITCELTGTKVENSRYTYLNMTFTILSKDVQRSIGFLDRGTPISFVMVDGTKVTMMTNKTDIGVVDIDKGTTTYRAQLTVEKITEVTGSEIDYVRVNWSSGYEDYEVYDVDILKNLFDCLYKK